MIDDMKMAAHQKIGENHRRLASKTVFIIKYLVILNKGGHHPLRALPAQAGDHHYPAQDPPPALWRGVKAERQNQTGKLRKICLVKPIVMLLALILGFWCFS